MYAATPFVSNTKIVKKRSIANGCMCVHFFFFSRWSFVFTVYATAWKHSQYCSIRDASYQFAGRIDGFKNDQIHARKHTSLVLSNGHGNTGRDWNADDILKVSIMNWILIDTSISNIACLLLSWHTRTGFLVFFLLKQTDEPSKNYILYTL